MTGSDGVGVFDVCHDEVTSGHLIINMTEATTLTDGLAFINDSDLLKLSELGLFPYVKACSGLA